MKTKVIIILLLFNLSFLYGQKEAAHWFFGNSAGLDFNSGTPIAQIGSLVTKEGCASISNKNGKLLFYTDGSTVYNFNHDIMLNGEGLLGNNSSTQSAIIVPNPGRNGLYYIFTVDNAEKFLSEKVGKGLNYSIVDVNLNGGLGAVVEGAKNKHLITYDVNNAIQNEWKCSEKIAAILHEDEENYWVVTQFADTFYAFIVDEFGVNEVPIKSKVNENINIINRQTSDSQHANISALGYLKISPDGSKLAIVHSSTAPTSTSGKVYVYDFDNSTGQVLNNGLEILSGTYPYGVEFSAKSKRLYVTSNIYETIRGVNTFQNSVLHQFDLESSNIAGSQEEIHSSPNILAGALQLAINGKIYRAKYNQTSGVGEANLGVINKPDFLGKNCSYDNIGVRLSPGSNAEFGLPPFIASIFQFTFDYEFTCVGSATHFYMPVAELYDSLVWDFGDNGATSPDEDPYHVFSGPGEFEVTLTLRTDGVDSKPVKKIVQIVEPLEIMPDIYELYECDGTDDNSTDGLTTFNLEMADDPLSLGNKNFVDVYYYTSLYALNSDSENENSIPFNFRNTKANQLIYAKVVSFGTGCFDIGRVRLKTTESHDFDSFELYSCNQGTFNSDFDLGSYKDVIKSTLNLPSNSEISYHKISENAAIGYLPLNENYVSNERTIFFRIENEDICYGIGELSLKIYPVPELILNEELNICETEFPLVINSGIDSNEIKNYTYEWENGEVSDKIDVSQAGEYHVIITGKSNFCSQIKTIKVNLIEKPEIQEIEIQEDAFSAYSVIVKVNNASDYLYSLNNDFGINRSDPTFRNLAPGTYTAYVTDKFNCKIVEKQFYIFGFPKFFTPNNDGLNDFWEIKGIDYEEYTFSNVTIFNKYGKHLATISPDSGWNGIYNGRFLPPDDYWFSVIITDKDNISNVLRGHFSLIER